MSREVAEDEQQQANVVQLPSSEPDGEDERPYKPGGPNKIVLIGLGIILAAFGGFGTWAATAPLDSASVAPGTVVVESNRKAVQHLQGGFIERIFVENGERVQTGEVLLQLDPTKAKANMEAVRARLDAKLAQRARLTAERQGADSIRFPETLRERSDTPRVKEVMAGERRTFAQRRRAREGKIAVQRQKITRLKQEINGVEARLASKKTQRGILDTELASLRELNEQGLFPETRVMQRERELAKLKGNMGQDRAQIARAKASISRAKLQIEQVRKQFQEKVATRLREVSNKIAGLRKELVSARDKLMRTTITAPQPGIVQNLKVHTETSAVVEPGQTVLQIVPGTDRLVVEARVKPTDINDVSDGQDAEVRLSAFDQRTTPVLQGKVANVSPDRIEPARQGQGGGAAGGDGEQQAFYRARIVIPARELEKLGDQKLQAGMPAQVLIKTGERTMVEYLMKPFTDAMSTAFTS